MRRRRNVGVALTGLLVVAAISVAAGSGRKPVKEQGASVSLRPLSVGEIKDILRRFPEMVSGRIASDMNDTVHIKQLFPFSEVTSDALSRAFPGVKFYEGRDFGRLPSYPYMMAITGGKRYAMPGKFNHLLLDGGQKVTDENIVALAMAFVIAAMGSEYYSLPEITFLDATRTRLKAYLVTDDAAILKVKIGEQIEEWHFSVLRSQFEGVSRIGERGFIKDYLLAMVESPPGRSQLDSIPGMAIDTSWGNAYVEYDTLDTAHY